MGTKHDPASYKDPGGGEEDFILSVKFSKLLSDVIQLLVKS